MTSQQGIGVVMVSDSGDSLSQGTLQQQSKGANIDSVYEFVINLETFKNVDLFRQG